MQDACSRPEGFPGVVYSSDVKSSSPSKTSRSLGCCASHRIECYVGDDVDWTGSDCNETLALSLFLSLSEEASLEQNRAFVLFVLLVRKGARRRRRSQLITQVGLSMLEPRQAIDVLELGPARVAHNRFALFIAIAVELHRGQIRLGRTSRQVEYEVCAPPERPVDHR